MPRTQTKAGRDGAQAPRPNLREAQKAFTRARILDAARELFHSTGYYGTTIDQIVSAAGASRPTFYLHFADKEEILKALIDDYTPRAVAQMERLPGPSPSLAEVRAWMAELVIFFEREKATVSIMGEIGSMAPTLPSYLRATVEALIAAFARRFASFAPIGKKDPLGLERQVRAEMLITQTTWAGVLALQNKGRPYGEMVLTVVAQAMHDFIHDPRFGAPKP